MPTALIVEDEPQANKLLSMLVQLRGYTTESAFTGQEALEIVRNRVPDVVFLDLMLPDLNGYDVCRALKASGKTSQVPVVIVTARVAAENRIDGFQAGADDYVPKPYTPDQIFASLDRSRNPEKDGGAPESEWHGQVVLDGRDNGETLRRLARLRGLLMAHTALEPAAVDRISMAVRAIWSSADNWGRRAGVDRVASLSFELSGASLVLTVHDESDWFAKTDDLRSGLASVPVNEARFDEIERDPDGRFLRLVKKL